jgi:cyclic pyranopterin phosphate synthase
MLDGQKRKIEYVRISLTDRCNLRCQYCMPAAGIEKLRHEDILTFDEVVRVSRALASLGVRKIRLTGGEPLVRRGIVGLVRELKAIDGIEQVVLTTNGVQLAALAQPLREAGLDGINLSLDTLDPAVFHRLTRIGSLDDALAGLQAAREAGIRRIKINCVPLAGVNEPDICRLADFAQRDPIQVRYIELMPIGCARTAGLRGIPTAKVRQMLEEHFGLGPMLPVQAQAGAVNGPAVCYRLPGFAGEIGFIDALEHKFCASCNRVRLTAEGFLKLCLNAKDGLDLRELLRGGISDENLRLALRQSIWHKPVEHHFKEAHDASRDRRAMYQVGG